MEAKPAPELTKVAKYTQNEANGQQAHLCFVYFGTKYHRIALGRIPESIYPKTR